MKLRGVSQEVDQIQTDALVLSFFQDERPLKGTAGMSDWHMCGRLSKLIMARFVDGKFGEPLLMPAARRMACQKILLIGLGPTAKFDFDLYRSIVNQACDALRKLQVTHFALPLPGIGLSSVDAGEAAEYLGKILPSKFGPDQRVLENLDVMVIADRNQLKSIAPVLARLERTYR
jgi:hypothetical protein